MLYTNLNAPPPVQRGHQAACCQNCKQRLEVVVGVERGESHAVARLQVQVPYESCCQGRDAFCHTGAGLLPVAACGQCPLWRALRQGGQVLADVRHVSGSRRHKAHWSPGQSAASAS